MAVQTRQSSKRSAEAAEASTRSHTTLPSPSLTPEKSFAKSDNVQPNKTAVHSIYSPISPISPISPEIPLPTSRPSWLSSSDKGVTAEEEEGGFGDRLLMGVQALLGLKSKAEAVDVLIHRFMLRPSDDSTNDEEETSDGSTSDEEGTSTTSRHISCHGNTFRTLEPHRGSALWELTGQPEPALSNSEVIPSETRSGELDCPLCSRFERLRNRGHVDASNERGSTVPLSEGAEENIDDRRTGAATYDDAHHELALLPRLTPYQLKRQKHYVSIRSMTEEEHAQWEAGLPAQRQRRREARNQRARKEMMRAREADLIQRRAINRARREAEKETRVVKPRVSFKDFVANLPAPDPRSLEKYKEEFVPSVDIITSSAVTANTVSNGGTQAGPSGVRRASASLRQKGKRPMHPLPSRSTKRPKWDNTPLAPSRLRK